jgi:hypothetical protein
MSLGGQWAVSGNGSTAPGSITQSGVGLTYNGPSGTFSGSIVNPTQVMMVVGGNTVMGMLVNGTTIQFANGQVWTKLDQPPLNHTVSGTNPGGKSVSLTVTQASAFIINASGQASHVNITSRTTLVAIDGASAGLTGTRVNGGIMWSNGVFWSNFDFNALNAAFGANVTPSTGAHVLSGTNAGGIAVSIIAAPTWIWISNASGQLAHVQITSASTLVVADGASAGVTGTITSPGTITWSNGTVWSHFNAAALSALFANVPHYPFPP